MKYTEIDGQRYEVQCCRDCPFYNNGEFKMGLYHSECKHPRIAKRVESAFFNGQFYLKGVNTHDIVCPLREVGE